MNGVEEYKYNLFAFSDILSRRLFRFGCYKCHLMPPFQQSHLFLLQASPIPKCEIHTWGHRLQDDSHILGDHICYMSKEGHRVWLPKGSIRMHGAQCHSCSCPCAPSTVGEHTAELSVKSM